MDSRDRMKLKAAGFRIFRKRVDGANPRACSSIWELSYSGGWQKIMGFSTNLEMEEDWKYLMNDEKNIGE